MSKMTQAMMEYQADPIGDHHCDYPEVKQWNKYYRKIAAAMKVEMSKIGLDNISLSRGHKSLTGFATNPDSGKIIYLSLSADFDITNILVRTAESYKDYRGGSNHYVDARHFSSDLKRFVDSI